jgi:flagellin-like protein
MDGATRPEGATRPSAVTTGTRRKGLAPLVGSVVLFAVVVGALWYRASYGVLPGQGAGSRIRWCGRDYDGGGPAESLSQIQATYGASYQIAGDYPPLALSRSQLVAPEGLSYCPTVIFVSVGPDQYDSYGLSGGP